MSESMTTAIERPPIVIEFMLNCYFSHSPEVNLGPHRWDSSAGRAVRRWLWVQRLIDDDNRPTEHGRAWVKAICSTPVPPLPSENTEAA